MKVHSIKLTERQRAALRKAARARGLSDGSIMREALDDYLGRIEPASAVTSAAALAADLLGIVNGPSDLSTNPKHLQGFGR